MTGNGSLKNHLASGKRRAALAQWFFKPVPRSCYRTHPDTGPEARATVNASPPTHCGEGVRSRTSPVGNGVIFSFPTLTRHPATRRDIWRHPTTFPRGNTVGTPWEIRFLSHPDRSTERHLTTPGDMSRHPATSRDSARYSLVKELADERTAGAGAERQRHCHYYDGRGRRFAKSGEFLSEGRSVERRRIARRVRDAACGSALLTLRNRKRPPSPFDTTKR